MCITLIAGKIPSSVLKPVFLVIVSASFFETPYMLKNLHVFDAACTCWKIFKFFITKSGRKRVHVCDRAYEYSFTGVFTISSEWWSFAPYLVQKLDVFTVKLTGLCTFPDHFLCLLRGQRFIHLLGHNRSELHWNETAFTADLSQTEKKWKIKQTQHD